MHSIDETKIKQERALIEWNSTFKIARRGVDRLAELARTDLLKEVVNEAVARKAYARVAKDRNLEVKAIRVRMYAMRCLVS